MEITFTKMHGLGNDFVVIDAINQDIALDSKQVQFIADRHFGIGCDQVLLVESTDHKDADFRYRIFNNDGSEVEHCGNGARCFAKFVFDEGLTKEAEIPVITKSGIITLVRQPQTLNPPTDRVSVNMGAPVLTPSEIPFIADRVQNTYELDIDGEKYTIGAISMGNPHAVIVVNDVKNIDIEKIGKSIQVSDYFPNSVNVGFMQVIDRSNIKLRVYERGVGETQACGTGTCAAVVAGRLQGLLNEAVNAQLLGGNLSIHWAGEQNPVMMTGPAASVFKGKITL